MSSFFGSFGKKKEETMDNILRVLNKSPLNTVTLQSFQETYERLKKILNLYTTNHNLQNIIAQASTSKETLFAIDRNNLKERSDILKSLHENMEMYRTSFMFDANKLIKSPSLPETFREKLGQKIYELDMLAREAVRLINKAKSKYDIAFYEKPLTNNEKMLLMPMPPKQGGRKKYKNKKTRKNKYSKSKTRRLYHS